MAKFTKDGLPVVEGSTIEEIARGFTGRNHGEVFDEFLDRMRAENPYLAKALDTMITTQDDVRTYLFFSGALFVYESLRREQIRALEDLD